MWKQRREQEPLGGKAAEEVLHVRGGGASPRAPVSLGSRLGVERGRLGAAACVQRRPGAGGVTPSAWGRGGLRPGGVPVRPEGRGQRLDATPAVEEKQDRRVPWHPREDGLFWREPVWVRVGYSSSVRLLCRTKGRAMVRWLSGAG